jgi:hypothetical protein
MNPERKLRYEKLRSVKMNWTTYLMLRHSAILHDRTISGEVRWLLKRRGAPGVTTAMPKTPSAVSDH